MQWSIITDRAAFSFRFLSRTSSGTPNLHKDIACTNGKAPRVSVRTANSWPHGCVETYVCVHMPACVVHKGELYQRKDVSGDENNRTRMVKTCHARALLQARARAIEISWDTRDDLTCCWLRQPHLRVPSWDFRLTTKQTVRVGTKQESGPDEM